MGDARQSACRHDGYAVVEEWCLCAELGTMRWTGMTADKNVRAVCGLKRR